jgi:biopolymer transport protein ExbD
MIKQNRRISTTAQEEESLINLTPLIDVVFVILIMFILLAPMVDLDRVELVRNTTAQRGKAPSVDGEHPVVIHVLEDNTILLNGTKTPLAELKQRLSALHHKYPHVALQLFHDRHAYFETYQAIKLAAEDADFAELEVILLR